MELAVVYRQIEWMGQVRLRTILSPFRCSAGEDLVIANFIYACLIDSASSAAPRCRVGLRMVKSRLAVKAFAGMFCL
jgi:hypothetical protein